MDKTRGELKRAHIKNKRKGNIVHSFNRSFASLHKPVRNYIGSYLRQTKYDEYLLDEFEFPSKINKIRTCWDCRAEKPKVIKNIYPFSK